MKDTKHLSADLPNSLPGTRYPASLVFRKSTSILHTAASRDQAEGAAVATLRSQLRADHGLWGSVDPYSARLNKWAWLPTVTLLLNVLRGGARQPGPLVPHPQGSGKYKPSCPDAPQACLEACYLWVTSVFIICLRGGRQQSLSLALWQETSMTTKLPNVGHLVLLSQG